MRVEHDGCYLEISELLNDERGYVLSITSGSLDCSERETWRLGRKITNDLLKTVQRALQLEQENETQTLKEDSQS